MELIALSIAGLAGGLIGGMGMGGGTLLIPILTLLYGFPQHFAQAANLISFIPMAAIAVALHAKNGLIRTRYLFAIALPAAISAGFTALVAANMNGEILRNVFGWFLIAVGALKLIETLFTKKNLSLAPLIGNGASRPLDKYKKRRSTV